MLQYDTTKFENSCRDLIAAFQNRVEWKWDDRFETVLAEFDSGDMEWVQGIIGTCMGTVWTKKNAGDAPEVVKIVIEYFGGLNPGQQLFTSDPDHNDLVLCAWWPWGNGQTISIRMAVFDKSLSDADNDELIRIFKGWFQL